MVERSKSPGGGGEEKDLPSIRAKFPRKNLQTQPTHPRERKNRSAQIQNGLLFARKKARDPLAPRGEKGKNGPLFLSRRYAAWNESDAEREGERRE